MEGLNILTVCAHYIRYSCLDENLKDPTQRTQELMSLKPQT